MSLNGLDSQPVQDAYQAAILEPGGWFLMKYCSRDAIELLAQGKSGVNGARNAIAKYEEASPLYGLLIYRRRRVLIKFIPEGTSRLLQARTAVHFQDVLERYSPYETLLEITNSEALNDTSLASAFPLHTASPAVSSNRLHEISEDAEDGGGAMAERPLDSSASTGNVFGTQRYNKERRVEQIMKPERLPPSIRVTGETPPSPTSKRPAISQFLVREDLGHTSIQSLDSSRSVPSVTEHTAPHALSLNRPDPAADAADRIKSETPVMSDVKPDFAHGFAASGLTDNSSAPRSFGDVESERAETPIERPSISDSVNSRARTSTSVSDKVRYDDELYDLSKFEYKPKVKLGPRPVASSDVSKRPITASIAAIPSQYRSAPKKQDLVRPKSQGANSVISSASTSTTITTATATHPTLPAPPPIPAASDYNPRPVSRGSVKSMPTHKSTAMTPDKIRLMKAVELRKRQLRKSTPQEAFQPPTEEDVLSIPPIPEVPVKSPQRVVKQDEPGEDGDGLVKEADSGIEMRDERAEVPEMQNLRRDPTPPTAAAGDVPTPAVEDPQTPVEAANGVEPIAEITPPAASETVKQGLLPLSTNVETSADPGPTEPEVEALEDSVDLQSDLTPVPTIVMDDSSVSHYFTDDRGTDIVDMTDRVQTTIDDETASTAPPEELAPLPPQRSDLAKRRRGVVEPLHLDVNPPGNAEDFTDDDDFLEELRTAPLEQAKPIQVAKSPATSDFPMRRPSTASGLSETGASVRSIRIKKSTTAMADRAPDSLSRISPEPSQVPHYTPTGMYDKQEPAGGTGLARNVSSGISKRIQALAEMSSRESISSRDNVPSRPLTPETSPNAFLQRDRERNAMVRNAHKARPISFRRQSSKSSATSGSPQVGPGENAPIVSVQRDAAGNRNSVSVTARIVRPNAARDTGSNNPSFQQSELKISTPPARSPPQPTYIEPAESIHSLSPPGALSPPLSPVSTESRPTGRFGRKHSGTSPSPEDFPPPPTSRSGTSPEESASAREGSRTSRFLKRMSNLGGGGKRKSGPQRTSAASSVPSAEGVPTRMSEPRAAPPPEKPDTPPAIVVGDLNVQFPDSLLWKRRIVTIDENGNLQFAIAQAMDIHKSVAIKKFHLADFKLPYAPDLDYQELPNSVVLEFGDGTTLQVACEDAMTHRQVLHSLKAHWRAWAQPS